MILITKIGIILMLLLTTNNAMGNEKGTCHKMSDNKCHDSLESASVKYNRASNSDTWKKYINLIDEANSNYKSCNFTSCSCYQKVLQNDLSPWQKHGIQEEMVNSMRDKGTLYQIINHTLYRDADCMFPFRCKGVEHFILKLLPQLPDMELVLNTRDWPQVPRNYGTFPVFSFSKTKDYYDIMYPAWTFWEGGPAIALYPTGIGRWDLHIEKLKRKLDVWPWEKKLSKGFFRGSRTSAERDPLVRLSRAQPSLVDAQYTKNQAWKSEADTLGLAPASEVPLEDHCQYKYLFNYRGVAASFRFKHLFLCRSVVLHVGNEWQEFFYSSLKPWVHYVPLDSGSTQATIQDILEFLKAEDKIAESIAQRGFDFIDQHLKMTDIWCYWRRLLRAYAKLLRYKPTLKPNLIKIQQ